MTPQEKLIQAQAEYIRYLTDIIRDLERLDTSVQESPFVALSRGMKV